MGDRSDINDPIAELENVISASGHNYDNLARILEMFNFEDTNSVRNLNLAISLYRIFARLMAADHFSKDQSSSNREDRRQKQLQRYLEGYKTSLIRLMGNASGSLNIKYLELIMRILKDEGQMTTNDVWRSSAFALLLRSIVVTSDGDDLRKAWATKYMGTYYDCCYHSLDHLK